MAKHMVGKIVDKEYQRGIEFESNYRLSITSADQHYYSNPIFQKQFLHSFRPVDLTAGLTADSPLQPALNLPKEVICEKE